MVSGESGSTYLSALEAAEAHFPDQARLVQRLFYVNEAFHSMCEDLAEAAQALARVEQLSDAVREARRLEYSGLVDALLKEMREAIAQSKIVMLRRAPITPKLR
jgi:ATP-dependent protease HslVU (ClpYQ) ATPase subunit